MADTLRDSRWEGVSRESWTSRFLRFPIFEVCFHNYRRLSPELPLRPRKTMLSKLGCSQIESVNRGAKALDYLQSVQALKDANLLLPNLIIPDVNMPEKKEWMRAVKTHTGVGLEEPRPIVVTWLADWTSEVEAKCSSEKTSLNLWSSRVLGATDWLTTRLDDPQQSTPLWPIEQSQ